LLQRWLQDHPDQKEVPSRVKANLANIKSVLRKKRREGTAARPARPAPAARTVNSGLETLEEHKRAAAGPRPAPVLHKPGPWSLPKMSCVYEAICGPEGAVSGGANIVLSEAVCPHSALCGPPSVEQASQRQPIIAM
jgi:hypothetical protein